MGVGKNYEPDRLKDLIDMGDGTYFSLVSQRDAARAFSKRFVGLMSMAASNVSFRLDFPEALDRYGTGNKRMARQKSYAPPSNFSFNTEQFFFDSFRAPESTIVDDERFRLTITMTDPSTGLEMTEVIEQPVIEILGMHENNLRAAEAIYLLHQLIERRIDDYLVEDILATHPVEDSTPLYDEYRALIDKILAL